MTKEQKDEWFYCVIENSGSFADNVMGFEHNDIGTKFIPVFNTKEEAQQCFLLMPKDVMNLKYEVQAVIKEDLFTQTEETGHKIFIMDHKGQIIKELEK
jgi:hypothetical protein